METLEHVCVADGNGQWPSHCGKLRLAVLQELSTELPSDPAIPLLGTHPQRTESWDSNPALYKITKRWKQPKHPPTDKWVN